MLRTVRTYTRMIAAVFIGCAAISFQARVAWAVPHSLNVYIPGPRGGFGDIASNLQMIKKLRSQYPDLDLRVFVSDKAAPVLETLLPEWKKDMPGQVILGTKYYMENAEALPAADALVSFSTIGGTPNTTAPIALDFTEYGQISENFDEKNLPRRRDQAEVFGGVLYDNQELHAQGRPVYVMLNSGPDSSGLYISSEKINSPISKADLASRLKQEGLNSSNVKIGPNAKIAFSYSYKPSATQLYLDAVSIYARKPEHSTEEIVVFYKAFDGLNLSPLPENVKAIPVQKSTLELSEALIALSDLPPMVTGDGSLTFAIDHTKPFFYEQPSWKELSASRALSVISKGTDRQTRKKLEEAIMLDPAGRGFNPAHLADAFDDPAFKSAFQNGLLELKQKHSLPAKLFDLIDTASLFDPRFADGSQARTAIDLVYTGARAEQVQEKLIQTATNNRYSAEKRVAALRSLLAMKDWEGKIEKRVFPKMISEKLPRRFQAQLDRIFFRGIRYEPLRQAFIRALRDPSEKIRNDAERTLKALVEVSESPAYTKRFIDQIFADANASAAAGCISGYLDNALR